ncbi:nitric oxide reductase transcriptional regulator NorR [Pseudomonas sp. F1_0610]|uniref:nitric oxide reductase transcriptional regulator NorR n=1 Tax=Pseudomonas sp. F1_0610 TaxID=3114284 RepID=UPI0039C09D6A
MVYFTSLYHQLYTDLALELEPAVRMQRLVNLLQAQFAGSAVVLLQLDGEYLRPKAAVGLPHEVLGRSFVVQHHPRLAEILKQSTAVQFAHESTLPDPYDGLLQENPTQPLPVHDCVGISLYCAGRCWGVLTLDALPPTRFSLEVLTLLEEIKPLIEVVLRICKLESELSSMRLAWRENINHTEETTGGILGESAAIKHLLNELSVVAESDLPVLLQGETGVGKELFARWLHSHSQRKDKALIYVNCAALPEALAESELFGHVKGAFSGAVNHRQGRFEAAHNGTLFLDEIGELPLSIQAKLLRALQNGEVQRLGEDQPHYVNVRLITATNRQLSDEVKAGNFRADLYHRLSVYPVAIPALRDRAHDILLLAGHFLEINRARLGLRCLRLTTQAQQALQSYTWPGNVRELEHVISRAALKAFSRAGSRTEMLSIETQWLDLDLTLPNGAINKIATLESNYSYTQESFKNAVENYQRKLISAALSEHKGNWASAARALALDPSNLRKLAKRLQI